MIGLILALDKSIPRKLLGDVDVVKHKSGHEYERFIDCLCQLNAQPKIEIGNFYYLFWRDDGGIFYSSLPSDLDKIYYEYVLEEHQWIYKTVKQLLDQNYIVKMYNGNLGKFENFADSKVMQVNELAKLETALEDFVLYTIQK